MKAKHHIYLSVLLLCASASAQVSGAATLASMKPEVQHQYSVTGTPSMIKLSGDPSLLTETELLAVQEALQQTGNFAETRFFLIFGQSARIRSISTLPLKNTSYSFNIPPHSKIICVRMSDGVNVHYSGIQNGTPAWLKVSGVSSEDGISFEPVPASNLASAR